MSHLTAREHRKIALGLQARKTPRREDKGKRRSSVRRIEGLRHVEFLKERPSCIPQVRLKRQVQREGLNYESDAALWLHKTAARHSLFEGGTLHLVRSQWFSFIDANGRGFAEADIVLISRERRLAIVVECKRTWTQRGMDQLEHLYGPLLEAGTRFTVARLQVCKFLSAEAPRAQLWEDFEAWLDHLERGLAAGSRSFATGVFAWRKGWN